MIENFGDKINTQGFAKNPKNIRRTGRPKKLVNHINEELKIEGYDPVTPDHIKQAYLTICNLPYHRIKEMANNKKEDIPILYQLVAREMIGKRGMELLDKLLDRAVGKPTQPLDHTSKGPISINISGEDAKL